jgi:transposase
METVIGVDPHKYVLTAVALDARGGVLGRWSGAASAQGFGALRAWATERAPGAVWAIEGSNRLGRRLAVLVAADGADVRDVCPTRTADRRRRRPGRGKSDAVDAEAIARELLAHPDLPRAFKAAAAGPPDPLREELVVLVRARRQLVDRHRQVLNEAEPLLGELPAPLAEGLPPGKKVLPRLAAAARRRRTGERLTDLRLGLLRAQAREERALAAACAALERQIVAVVRRLGTRLPGLCGLGPLGAAELLAEVGDPRRFRSADAFAAYTGTAPIPASSAEARGHPVHHRLSRFGNRRLNAVLYRMALVRQRVHPETRAYTARLLAAGKTPRDALRIVKRRLARLVWQTMTGGPRRSAREREPDGPANAAGPADAADERASQASANTGKGWFAREPATPPAAGAGRHPEGRSAAEQPSGARLDAPAGAEPPAPLGLP